MNSSYITKYTITFVIVQILIISYFYQSIEKKEQHFNNQQITELEKEYKNIENLYKNISSIIYEEIIAKPEFLTVIRDYEKVSKHEQQLRREALYMKLSSFYRKLQLRGFQQLHFHSINNQSILRFHQPEKFDDDLSDNRYSIYLANKYKKRIHGFEEGIFFNGFRNVFPIIFEDVHIGSVEISLKFQEFNKKLSENFNKDYRFIISNNVTKKNILTETNNIIYSRSVFSKHFLEEVREQRVTVINETLIEEINKIVAKKEQLNILNMKKFVTNIEVRGKGYSITFLPIKNVVGKELAYVVSYKKDGFVKDEYQKATLFYFLINITILAFIFLFHYNKKDKEMSFVKTILDSQDNMLLITDGKKAKEINKTLLNFLGYERLDEFQEEHQCICDFFIEEKGYLYPDKNREWLSYVLNVEKEQKVKILDERTKEEKTFILRVTKIKNKHLYIVNFNDVSSIESEKTILDLESKSDKLTKQFNKRKFEEDIEEKIKYSKRYDAPFSIIIYDLDYFKRINDTFGHQKGDEVLERISKIIRENTRESDLLYRWGGEEFIIITNTVEKNAIYLSEKLRKKVEECYFFNIGKITCSFGVTAFQKDDTTDSLVKRADTLLYKAKNSGRNRICYEV